MNRISIWHVFMTDITAEALRNELAARFPDSEVVAKKKWWGRDYDVLIGWGCKPDDRTPEGDRDIERVGLCINRYAAVRRAADKLQALEIFSQIPELNSPRYFLPHEIKDAIADGRITYPFFGRAKEHQDGTGTWLCGMMLDVDQAIREGADYFVEFIRNKDEYRIHVFDGEVLQSMRTVLQRNPKEGFKEEKLKKLNRAWKNKEMEGDLDERTANFVLDRLMRSEIQIPFNMIRHYDRGWRFSPFLAEERCPEDVRNMAVQAVNSLGLDFGAVDIIKGEDDTYHVLEVNTAPALWGRVLTQYVDAFEKKIRAHFQVADEPENTQEVTENPPVVREATTLADADRQELSRAALRETFGVTDEQLDKMKELFRDL